MGINLLLSALYKSRRIVIAVNLAFLIGSVALALLLPPVYRAETLLVPNKDQSTALTGMMGQLGGLADLAGISIPGDNNRATYIATLRSRELTEQFIREANLLPILFPNQWDAAHDAWKDTDPEDQPTTWEAVRLFDRKIRFVDEDRRTGLVTLAIEWRDPKQAADWTNELVRRCNAALRSRALADGRKTLDFVSKELERTSQLEVRQLLFRLIEAETKKIALAVTRDDYAFQVVDHATAPSRRERPNRLLIVAVGVTLGLVTSLGILFIRSSGATATR